MTPVSFIVAMAPRGQGRPRVATIGGHARAYKAAVDVQHERTLAALCAPYRPRGDDGAVLLIGWPVRVELVAVLPRPQSLCKVGKRTGKPLQDPGRRWHTGRPDVDNCGKALLDALRDWWRDDCLVVQLVASKQVAALHEAPHYEITISKVEEWQTPDNC